MNTCKNGGTIFHFENEQHIVENVERRATLFDMSIEHETQRMFEHEIKYAISFRCITQNVENENNDEQKQTFVEKIFKSKKSTKKKTNA